MQLFQLTGSGNPDPGLQLFWNRNRNVATVHAFRLKPLAAGRAYQLWFIKDGKPVPSVTFTPEAGGGSLQPISPRSARRSAPAQVVRPMRASLRHALLAVLLPSAAFAQAPADLARERAEYAGWLATAPNSPFAAVALQPAGTGLSLGPADADIPLKSIGTARVTPQAGGLLLEASSGRRLLRPGALVPLGPYRLTAVGSPGRLLLGVFGPDTHPKPLRYFPYDSALVFVVTLTPAAQPETGRVLAADGVEVPASDAGTITVPLGTVPVHLRVLRLPGAEADESELEIFFRDATNGHGSYPAGRFVSLIPAGQGRYRLDFNRARNPFCAYSGVYPCPAPWRGNTFGAAVRAGEQYEAAGR